MYWFSHFIDVLYWNTCHHEFTRGKYQFALVQYCKWYVEQFRAESGFMIQLKPALVRLSLHSFHILSYLHIYIIILPLFFFLYLFTHSCQNMMNQKYHTYKFIGVLRLKDIFADKIISFFAVKLTRRLGSTMYC